jgi:murein L,D-transpeptidase YafK
VGAKERQGDAKTPEGRYVIDWHNPQSKYRRSLHISYPGPADRERAAARGIDPGGDIMIHGLAPKFAHYGRRHRLFDWTNGCIAVTNEEMDEIWGMVKDGTPIIIYP